MFRRARLTARLTVRCSAGRSVAVGMGALALALAGSGVAQDVIGSDVRPTSVVVLASEGDVISWD
ncbi:hypothetical protein [Streptomyces purpureus]|uniref:hypothetical protein n=1 Tax=Streptomyces purpureus TaxID=1951 RepID=UPI0003711C56|nr:hypothetical protein [Streptomyces purpureus]